MPPTKQTAKPVKAMIIVVPKSGSSTASTISAPTIAAAGTAPFRNFSIRQPAQSRKTAADMTTKSLPSSLGWNRTDAVRRNQRCDPFVSGANRTAAIRPAMTR